MVLFKNRKEAGRLLAEEVCSFLAGREVLILALPRGGVVVGYEIAQVLGSPLDVICPRKIGAPGNSEYALGAITETGEGIFSDSLLQELSISQQWLQESIAAEKEEAQRRLRAYRGDYPPRKLLDKAVLLVDDGVATGATMMAAIKSVKKEGAKEVIVALPVAPPESAAKIAASVDKLICLATPTLFYAISQFYEHFDQTSDEEVIALLRENLKNF